MAAPKLLSLFALASLLVVALSFGPLHVNALVADRAQVARHVHARDAVAKRKRSGSPSCQPKPTTPPPPSTPTTPLPSSPSTPSATPSPTSTSAGTSNNGKQWCLAYGADPALLSNFARPKVGRFYNWAPTSSLGLQADGLSFMPMLWGTAFVTDFLNNVVNGPDNPGGIALGFNEPNEPTQSNILPADAAGLWKQYMNPLSSKGYTLASPACTDDDAGLVWYQEFFGNCSSACTVDHIAFHAYTTNAQDLINYAQTLYDTYHLPIMITEFADQDYSGNNQQATMDQVWAFANTVVNFVANTAWIEYACPFGIMNPLPNNVNAYNALLDPSSDSPTPLGYYYFG